MLSDPFASAFLTQCSSCAGLLNRSSALQCRQCGCAYYCNQACQRAHWRQADNPSLAHSAWCARLRLFRQRAPALAEHPFGFAAATTAEGFDSQGLARFLMECGLLGRGMWRRECYAWLRGLHRHPADEDNEELDDSLDGVPPLPGELAPDPEPYGLPAEAAVLAGPIVAAADADAAADDEAASQPVRRIGSWSEYYQLRQLPPDSPVCILLQWPLTLYHALFNLTRADAPDAFARLMSSAEAKRRPIVIHLIGAEKEVELIPALCELAQLAPGYSFQLDLIGKDVSPSVHKSVYVESSGRMRVAVYRGLYHQVAAGLLRQPPPPLSGSDADAAAADDAGGDSAGSCRCGEPARPDLILAPNAGFAASISWPATLEFLRKLAVRTYVTDYCEFSMELSALMCEKLKVGTLTPQRVNPFRSPIRVPNEQLDLPSYSNAFISELVYPQSASS